MHTQRCLLLAGMVMTMSAAAPTPTAQGCAPEGDIQFLCGPVSPEDLIAVPDTPWVIVSGMENDGYLYVADIRDHSSRTMFPTAGAQPRHDSATFGACPGPVTGVFRPHGISLRLGSDDRHTLYVVRHGERESIEVFTLDTGSAPSVTWVGCVVAPEGVAFNSVAALPDGAIAATNFQLPMGELWEWQPGGDWVKVQGSETSGPNGLVASPDGRWLYIGGWGTKSLIRLSRGQNPIQTNNIPVSHHVDNVRLAPDGSLLAAGHVGDNPNSIFQCVGARQCAGVTSRVSRVDTETLTAEEIVRYPSSTEFILGTVAIQVGDEIWMGGIGGSDRIVRLPAP